MVCAPGSACSSEADVRVGMIGRKLRVAWGTAFFDGCLDVYVANLDGNARLFENS